jgi:hypothetical protein
VALIVEDGSGKSDAQSYVSVADADSYHTNHSASTDWTNATTAEKEKALRLATQWLDASYHGRWKGVRFSAGQALDWPRDSVELDGYVLSASDLPQQLLDATCEMALKEVQGDVLLVDLADEGTIKSKTVRVGPITDSKTYEGGSRGIKKYRLAESLVRPLIRPSGQMQRA